MKLSICGSFQREVKLTCLWASPVLVYLLNIFMMSTLVHVHFFATSIIRKFTLSEKGLFRITEVLL